MTQLWISENVDEQQTKPKSHRELEIIKIKAKILMKQEQKLETENREYLREFFKKINQRTFPYVAKSKTEMIEFNTIRK